MPYTIKRYLLDHLISFIMALLFCIALVERKELLTSRHLKGTRMSFLKKKKLALKLKAGN